MTEQEMFDRAYLGVLRQGALAKNEDGRCQYTTPQGLHCGVGHLMTEEQLAKALVTYGCAGLLNNDVPCSLVSYGLLPADFNIRFADTLQEAHDGSDDLEVFRDRMETVAIIHLLKVPEFVA